MAISTHSVNRVTISDLPAAQSIKDDDFLILQSDGVSSKLQVSDLKLSRTNLSFYNEIVDLNRLTAAHADDIMNLKQAVNGEDQSQSTDRIAQLESKVDTLTSSLNTLSATVDNIKTATELQLQQQQQKVAETSTEVSAMTQRVAETSTEVSAMTQRLSTSESQVQELKQKQEVVITHLTTSAPQLLEDNPTLQDYTI